jgi:hypothetical protein
MENKFYSTTMQSEKHAMKSEKQLHFIIISSTLLIITSIITSSYISSFERVSSNYIDKESVKKDKKE